MEVEMNNGFDAEIRQQMTSFWKEHSKNGDLTEMMLDSNADKMSDLELDEIMNFLPDIQGKAVLELGAGIGRFTGRISEKARSVVAVDFMDKFISKNKERNGHLKNLKLVCSHVLDISFEEDSLDVIFSNWLFMYLGDKEMRVLIDRMLDWLKPGGRLFFRESCYEPSGDKKLIFNPTIYRNPNEYTGVITSVTETKNDGIVYGFDVVSTKSVETYIKFKNNRNQICWLMESAPRNIRANQGYETFQKFLDEKLYSRNGILQYEEIFGQDYVSTGGHTTTKEFCAKLGLKPGSKVLDVGCGIGGSAFHMAREYGAEVIGIDLSANMIDIAQERQKSYNVQGVFFEVADATKVDYAEESFDVVYSRDTILHISDKESLFANFFKWIKPGGKILITDYTCGPHDKHSPAFKDYVKQRGYVLLTAEQYGEVLQGVGFVNVEATDKTESFVGILRKELEIFAEKKGDFVKKFTEQDYNAIESGWRDKLDRCGKGDQKWGLFYGEKE